jgi:nitrite reductase/ring-hydroxylating ferredoxin subunit
VSVRVAAGERTLAPGEVRVVRLPRGPDGLPREALLLRDQVGVLRAYLNRCRHLPIPIDGGSRRFLTADGQHLLCGTHGARYRLEDGHCVQGPCMGLSLHALDVEVDGDALYLVVPD